MAQTNTNLDQNKFAAAEELPKAQSKVKEFTKKFMKRKTAVVSLVFILFIVLMAIIAPFVVPYAPDQPDYTALLQGPSSAHIWGTDEFGQDVFSRLMVGSRLSLSCALIATVIGTAGGVILGLIAGFYGGFVDSLIMRCCDVLFAFPDILLAIAVVAIIGPGMVNVMIAVAVFTVPSFAQQNSVCPCIPWNYSVYDRKLYHAYRYSNPCCIIPEFPGIRSKCYRA